MKTGSHNYGIRAELLSSLHCPTCRSNLKGNELLDSFVHGLVCAKNHRFYVPLEATLSTMTEKTASLTSLSSKDDLDLIRSWLTTSNLRPMLNDQLATMLRRIFEIKTGKIHINYPVGPMILTIFKYCPICSEVLSHHDQDDVWVEGLKCSKGHQFRLRNGLDFPIEDTRLNLSEEMSDETLQHLIDAWLSDKPELNKQLPTKIRQILINFKKGTSRHNVQ